MLEKQGDYVTTVISNLRKQGPNMTVDVKPEAEDDYVNFCANAATRLNLHTQCISYYNQEGTAKPQDLPYSSSGRKYTAQCADAIAGLKGEVSSPFVVARGKGNLF